MGFIQPCFIRENTVILRNELEKLGYKPFGSVKYEWDTGYGLSTDNRLGEFESFDDVSSADIYQVTTYCLLHGHKKAILLYPQWSDNPLKEENYCLNCEDKYEIKFASVNLKLNLKEDLKSGNSKVVKELREILN